MVATDSYRLSVKETALETPLQGSLEANVPARALQELARIAQAAPAESLAVSVGQNQVVFELGDVVLSSRLIDGQFPNYRQLLPESVEHELRLASAELTDVVRRISLLAQKNAPLRLSFSEGTLTVSAQTPDVGEASEAIPVPVPRRAVRDRLQPRVPARRPREHRVRRARAQADQPAAPRPDRIARLRRLRLPDHADPAERVTRGGASTCACSACSCATSAPTRAPKRALGPGLTVVHGPNGAGKSNLLEALYFGCTGRSPRTRNERELVRFGAQAARVVVRCSDGAAASTS